MYSGWGTRAGEGVHSHHCSLVVSSTGTKAMSGQSQALLTDINSKFKRCPCFCSWTLLWRNKGVLHLLVV